MFLKTEWQTDTASHGKNKPSGFQSWNHSFTISSLKFRADENPCKKGIHAKFFWKFFPKSLIIHKINPL